MFVMFRRLPVGVLTFPGMPAIIAGNVLNRRVFKSAGFGIGSQVQDYFSITWRCIFGAANGGKWMRKFAVRFCSEEYRSLAAALEKPPRSGLVH